MGPTIVSCHKQNRNRHMLYPPRGVVLTTITTIITTTLTIITTITISCIISSVTLLRSRVLPPTIVPWSQTK